MLVWGQLCGVGENSGFFFRAEGGIRDAQESRGLGDVYKRRVRRIAGGEQQSSGFAVPVGQFPLELDVIMGIAADIASAAGTGANIVQRFFHSGDDVGMLAHCEIIIRAPHLSLTPI